MTPRVLDAGYDHVYLHQIGPDQKGFKRFFENELSPSLGRLGLRQAVERRSSEQRDMAFTVRQS